MKPIVICIVGASGSGKTHMSKFLYEGFGIPMVVSMTTRPKIRNEVDGIDHKFVSKQVLEKKKKRIIYWRTPNMEIMSIAPFTAISKINRSVLM